MLTLEELTQLEEAINWGLCNLTIHIDEVQFARVDEEKARELIERYNNSFNQ